MHLILAKDSEERRRSLETLLKKEIAPIISFEFSQLDVFFLEIETLPFLSKTKAIVLYDIDQLSQEGQDRLFAYTQRPNKWISLYLTADSLPPQNKLLKSIPNVISFKEEKPWEKEKRLVDWVIKEAKEGGAKITSAAAQALVKGVDSQFLQGELEKLICYAGEQGEISLAAIHALSTPLHQETLWQLGEAIFARQTPLALQIGRTLLEEGVALFPLLAHLRTQFHTTLKIMTIAKQEGKAGVAKAYPYLKGPLLDKKVAMAQSFGLPRVQQGIYALFETELKAKNSAIEPALLLEILLVRLTNDALLTSQCVGTS